MKAFEELTYRGRIMRMRQVAQSALNAYGLCEPRIQFLRQAGNTLFRIYESNPTYASKPDLYAPGQYMLRIHDPGYQTPDAIELELAWLASMCRDADLPVPEPVARLDGGLLTQTTHPGVPGERHCSLLRWVRGKEPKKETIQPQHYRALGKLVARLHLHASQWQPPHGLPKRKYDWDGLFRKNLGDGSYSDECWSLLPPEYVEPFKKVSSMLKQLMDVWGKSPQVFGLIHADIGMQANVLFQGEQTRLIDFDDSGFGYYLFDLSIVLEDSQADQIRPHFREALLEGYTQVQPLSEEQVKSLDLFLAGFAVFWSLYCAEWLQLYPHHQAEILERMARYLRLVENFLAKI
jgi:Ser/Thr protein kinase RdoA (MazF antagonist)